MIMSVEYSTIHVANVRYRTGAPSLLARLLSQMYSIPNDLLKPPFQVPPLKKIRNITWLVLHRGDIVLKHQPARDKKAINFPREKLSCIQFALLSPLLIPREMPRKYLFLQFL